MDKDARNAARRLWYLAHKEEHKAKVRAYAKANPEVRRATQKKYTDYHTLTEAQRLAASEVSKKWQRENPERVKENHKKYAAKKPEVIRKACHNYRARKRGASGSYTVDELKTLKESYLGLCIYCPAVAEYIDHVVPLAGGGSNDIENLAPACAKCNQSKSDSSLLMWIFRMAHERKSCP